MARKPKKAKKAARTRRKPTVSSKCDPLDNFIAAGAQSLGLKIQKSWMPAVREHLKVTLWHGALAADFALPDESEPAPVFKA